MLHLFHPALVHFALALALLGALAEAAGLLARRPALCRLGSTLTVGGTLVLVPTIVTGYLAANVVVLSEPARARLELHELLGWIVLGWFVGLLFWKAWYRGAIPAAQRAAYAVALLAGALLVAGVGLLGGELVFVYGVGVADG